MYRYIEWFAFLFLKTENTSAIKHFSVILLPFKCQITGQTALHAACAAGSVGCVREILEAGADYDAVDSENNHSAHK